jgi:hypothetical protein
MDEMLINSNVVKPYIPAAASEKEKRIHGFLSDLKIFSVDVKGFIEDSCSNKPRFKIS